MRALLWMPRASVIPGGHRVQMSSTARALRELGVDVAESGGASVDLDGVDVVHGFGLTSEEIHTCRAAGIPVALSTIYADPDWESGGLGERHGARELAGGLRRAWRFGVASVRGRSTWRRVVTAEAERDMAQAAAYSAADVLLPNSRGEADAIRRHLLVTTPVHLVPNAVDPDRFDLDGDPGRRRDGVLYVGRIEPHKNQLGLIEAMRGSGLGLTIAGPPHPHHPSYVERCHRAGEGWVRFTGPVDDGLADLYRSAAVHVLPSWYETTGLVSLEAALCGCAVASTSRGHAREYLDDLAAWCDPAEPASIRRAVEIALEAGPSDALRERILERYTWRHAAEATLAAYRQISR